MDDATADLILTLQLEDLMSLTNNTHVNIASNGSTDTEIAVEIYREELLTNALTLSDHHFSTKVGEAAGNDDLPLSPVETPTPIFDRLLARYEEEGTESCIACEDDHPRRSLLAVPCGHFYCKPCIGGISGVDNTEGLFELAIKDESLFPPRCCKQPIPIDDASPFLDESQIRLFKEKSVEYATIDRTYCHDTNCGKFIHPSKFDGEKAKCQHCDLITCSVCKTLAHDGDCPNDPAYKQLMELAETEGWKRCLQCKRMVEMTFGCNHMTCYCKAEFCYLCATEWKKCACSQWDEDRLIERREQIVARAERPLEAAQVEHIEEDLRGRHECGHGPWRRVATGSLRCEECRIFQQSFVLQCPQCHLRVCCRCERHRL